MRWACAALVAGLPLWGCHKSSPNADGSGGQGGLAGSAAPAGGKSGAAGGPEASGGASGSGGATAVTGGVNGPSGAGPIVSFGDDVSLYSVAWSGSFLLAVGRDETLVQSAGTSAHWSLNGSAFFSGGSAVLWDGARFVTIGQSGGVNVSNGPDAGTALTLTTQGSVAPSGLAALAWSGSTYVGVGSGGLVATSPDARSWTKRGSGTNDSLVAVVWTGAQFVALGGTGTIVSSTDGVTWTVLRGGTAGATYNTMVWSGSRFVAAGNGFTETSTDAKAWAKTGGTAAMTCVAWSPALRLFAGGADAAMYTSPDGATWTLHAIPIRAPVHSVVWAGNRFVAVGDAGMILGSQDGARWIVESMGTKLSGVTWTGDRFVAVGVNGTHLTSADGLAWTIGYFDVDFDLATVAARPGGYAFGSQAGLISSADLVRWTSFSIGPTICPGLVWTGSQCLAVCESGAFWTAPDCQTWSTGQIAGANDQWSNVTWTGTQLVAVGRGGLIATSPDGTSWTTRVSGTAKNLSGVAWSGTTLVAVGDGVATTSPDGTAWTAAPVLQNLPLQGVAWAGTRFLAVGPQATLLQSPDGVTWSGTATTVPVNSLLFSSLNAIAFSGTRSIVVGDNGIILAVER